MVSIHPSNRSINQPIHSFKRSPACITKARETWTIRTMRIESEMESISSRTTTTSTGYSNATCSSPKRRSRKSSTVNIHVQRVSKSMKWNSKKTASPNLPMLDSGKSKKILMSEMKRMKKPTELSASWSPHDCRDLSKIASPPKAPEMN